jgi:hypothetical protein
MTLLQTPNGRAAIKVTLPTLGALSAIAGVLLFLFGMASGYQIFKTDMLVVNTQLADLRAASQMAQERMNMMSRTLADDRERDANRLTILESESKYISQGIAELKLALVPKR